MIDNKEYIFQVLYSLLDYFDLNVADDTSIEKMDELYDSQGLSEDDLEGLNIICDYFLYNGKSDIDLDQKRILAAEQVLKEVSDKLLDEIVDEMGLVISSGNNRQMVHGVLNWYKQKYEIDYGQAWNAPIGRMIEGGLTMLKYPTGFPFNPNLYMFTNYFSLLDNEEADEEDYRIEFQKYDPINSDDDLSQIVEWKDAIDKASQEDPPAGQIRHQETLKDNGPKLFMNNFLITQFMDEYPNAFHRIVELGMTDFDVWYLFESEQAFNKYQGLHNRYPDRKLIPFAQRNCNDDIACFEIGQQGKVQIIHDFASSGWEQRGEYNDVWEWLEDVIKEMGDYNREEEEFRERTKS